MNCRTLEPYIVDRARGVPIKLAHEAELARHLVDCPQCAATLERERVMSAVLQRLAENTPGPPPNPAAERDLMARFDAAQDRARGQILGARSAPQPTTPWALRTWSRVAAAVVIGVLLTGLVTRTVLRRDPAAPATSTASSAPPVVAPLPPVVPPAAAPSVAAAADVPVVTRASGSRPLLRDARQEGELLPVMEFVFWPGAAAWPPFESGELVQIDLPVSMLPTLGLPPPSADVEMVRADVIVGQDGFARAVRLVQ